MVDEVRFGPNVWVGSIDRFYRRFTDGQPAERVFPMSDESHNSWIAKAAGILSAAILGTAGLLLGPPGINNALLALSGVLAGLVIYIASSVYIVAGELADTEYVVTESKIGVIDRFLEQESVAASVNEITDVSMKQPIWQRILGVGAVKVNTAGSDTQELRLEYVPNPEELREELTALAGGGR